MADGFTKVAGKIITRPMGEYDATTTYDILDFVTIGNKLYISKKPGLAGVDPSTDDGTNWQMLIDGSADLDEFESAVNQRLATIEGDIDTANTAITNLESEVTANKTLIDNIISVNESQDALITAAQSTADEANTLAGQANEKIDSLEIGGRNLLLNTELIQMRNNGDSSIESESTIETVTEWNTTNAIRVTGTGGTSTIFGILRNSPHVTSLIDKNYAMSVYVKNNGTNELGVRFNIVDSSKVVNVSPGESKRVVQCGIGDGTKYLSINFSTTTAGEPFDITFWHPKIEEGTIATDWSPAPEDTQSALEEIAAISSTAQEKAESAEAKVLELEEKINSLTFKLNIDTGNLEWGMD